MADKEYIEREAVWNSLNEMGGCGAEAESWADGWDKTINAAIRIVEQLPSADVAPVRHGRWIYEVHKENVNFRWNVTVKCSECYDNRKEIWGGFFPNVPDCIARDVALQSAKQIKLDNYCLHCGAKMDEEV